MIRAGKMNRDEALSQVERIKKSTKVDEIVGILKEIRIPNKSIDDILK
jgi:hypothetical protein